MSNRIKLRQLRAYQAIMSTGSITSAAERLNTTQPAISKHLAALEEAIGMVLFNRRRGGPMNPTRAGTRFYKAIEGTLWGLDSIADIAREITEHSRARLRIVGTEPLINSSLLTGALTRFKAKYPNVRFFLEARHRLDIEEWVASRQADIGLALLPAESPLITTRSIIKTRAVAIVADTHRLAKRKSISLSDVEEERLILPSPQLQRSRIDASLSSADKQLNIDIEATSVLTCCKFAASGFGVAICDPFTPNVFSYAGLKVLKWEPEVSLTYGALFHREDEESEIIEEVLQFIREEQKSQKI